MRRLSFLGQELSSPGAAGLTSPPTAARSASAPVRAPLSREGSGTCLSAAAEQADGARSGLPRRPSDPTSLQQRGDAVTITVRLAGREAGPCVRVRVRREWAWAACLVEAQLRLHEIGALGAEQKVAALQTAAPPHARVVRAEDLAAHELLEAILSDEGAPPLSPPAAAREPATTPREPATPSFDLGHEVRRDTAAPSALHPLPHALARAPAWPHHFRMRRSR